MPNRPNVKLFFNFRSPYCYLASTQMFPVLEARNANIEWRPLGGWDGRSSPERAKVKVPLTRQDVARFARRLKIPFVPPPLTTDPTLAGVASLLAEERGQLAAFVTATMNLEWAEGQDIGQREVLHRAGERAGLSAADLEAAFEDGAKRKRLENNWREAQELGVIGVPTFVVGDQIFWGNDRLDFLSEHLLELAAGS